MTENTSKYIIKLSVFRSYTDLVQKYYCLVCSGRNNSNKHGKTIQIAKS